MCAGVHEVKTDSVSRELQTAWYKCCGQYTKAEKDKYALRDGIFDRTSAADAACNRAGFDRVKAIRQDMGSRLDPRSSG